MCCAVPLPITTRGGIILRTSALHTQLLETNGRKSGAPSAKGGKKWVNKNRRWADHLSSTRYFMGGCVVGSGRVMDSRVERRIYNNGDASQVKPLSLFPLFSDPIETTWRRAQVSYIPNVHISRGGGSGWNELEKIRSECYYILRSAISRVTQTPRDVLIGEKNHSNCNTNNRLCLLRKLMCDATVEIKGRTVHRVRSFVIAQIVLQWRHNGLRKVVGRWCNRVGL